MERTLQTNARSYRQSFRVLEKTHPVLKVTPLPLLFSPVRYPDDPTFYCHLQG